MGDQPPRSSFRLWLSNELRDRGWTQATLAQRMGVPQPSVSNWIKGRRVPREPACFEIARALGVPESEVFMRAGRQAPPRRPSGARDPRRARLVELLDAVDIERYERYETLEADLLRYRERDRLDALVRQAAARDAEQPA